MVCIEKRGIKSKSPRISTSDQRSNSGTDTSTGTHTRRGQIMPTDEDATLTLKSLLGISNPKIKTKTAPEPSSKTKSRKKKDKVKEGNGHANSIMGGSSSNDKPKSGKKKKKKASESQSHQSPQGQHPKSRGEKKKQENFAWSAFQSPPDASNLPLPAFGSDAFDTATSGTSPSNGDADVGGINGSCSSWTDKRGEAIEIEKVEAERMANANINISSAIASEDDIKALLNITGRKTQTERLEGVSKEDDNSEKETRITCSALEKTRESSSVSGVDLAALTLNANPKANDASTTTCTTPPVKRSSQSPTQYQPKPEEPMDPLASLMNPSYGRLTNNPNLYGQMPSPHQYLHPHSYNMQTAPPPGPYGPPHPHAMMPPSYLTLQVQVPPTLLPGRQMVVPVSPGYSFPVTVPEGTQPGMFIPVTVPNPGAYGQNPMMHSPAMGYGQNVGPFVQQHVYSTPAPQHSPLAENKPVSKPPAPGSWAAKAAAHPNEN